MEVTVSKVEVKDSEQATVEAAVGETSRVAFARAKAKGLEQAEWRAATMILVCPRLAVVLEKVSLGSRCPPPLKADAH